VSQRLALGSSWRSRCAQRLQRLSCRYSSCQRFIVAVSGVGQQVDFTATVNMGGSRRTVVAADGFAMAALLAMTIMAILLAMAGRAWKAAA
jgi:hypothetical protein